MDKKQFQVLRWSIEADIRNYVSDESVVKNIADSVMRTVLADFSTQATARQRNKRQFLTFRRNPEAIAPSWAFRKPGTAPGFPTLR
jgi:DNA primase